MTNNNESNRNSFNNNEKPNYQKSTYNNNEKSSYSSNIKPTSYNPDAGVLCFL